MITKQQSTQPITSTIEVNEDTVYFRTNVKKVKTLFFEGYEYDERTIPLREYLSSLVSEDNIGGIGSIISILMSEIDMLKLELQELKGVLNSGAINGYVCTSNREQ